MPSPKPQPKRRKDCHDPPKGHAYHPITGKRTTHAVKKWRTTFPFCPVPSYLKVLCCSNPDHVIYRPLRNKDWDDIKYPYPRSKFYIRYRDPKTWELNNKRTEKHTEKVLQLKDDLRDLRPYRTVLKPPPPPATLDEAFQNLRNLPENYFLTHHTKDLVPETHEDRVEHGLPLRDLRAKLIEWGGTP